MYVEPHVSKINCPNPLIEIISYPGEVDHLDIAPQLCDLSKSLTSSIKARVRKNAISRSEEFGTPVLLGEHFPWRMRPCIASFVPSVGRSETKEEELVCPLGAPSRTPFITPNVLSVAHSRLLFGASFC